jgi:TP901 family phage tail tape measure protein
MAFRAGAIYGEARLDTKKWDGGLKRITKGAAIAGAAIGVAFAAGMVIATKKANEFQKEMGNVSTLVDTTAINMQGLTKEVLLLNPALGGATELTKGLYQAFSAGAGTAEEAMQITTDSAMFAKAALTDMSTAVDVLTTAQNAYGKETVNTTQASDIFFQTIKYGKITGEELGASIGTSIPLFASAGIELTQLGAGMAAMTKQGVKSNVATTQLNAIISAFLKPSGEMIEKLQEMGYESGSAFLKAEGLAGGLKLVEEATGGDAAEMAKLLPNIRALRGAMALTGVGGEEFTRVLGEMETASGVTTEAFEKQEKTWDTLKAAMGRTQIVIGNISKHFVDKLAVGAIEAAKGTLAFIMSSQGMELVAEIAGYAAGGFELIKGIIEPLVDATLPVLSGLWDTITENIIKVTDETTSGAGAFKILSIAINLSTTAIAILGKFIEVTIKTVGDMILAIKDSSKTLGTFFDFLVGKAKWEEVEEQAGKAIGSIISLGVNQVGYAKEIFDTVTEELGGLAGKTEELATEVNVKVKAAYEGATNYMINNWGKLTTGQDNFMKGMLERMKELMGGIQASSASATESMSEMVERYRKHQYIVLDELEVRWEDYFDSILGGTSHLHSALFSALSQHHTNEQAENDLAYQADLAALDLKLENGLMTEEDYQIAKDELDQKNLEKKNALALKVFNAEKANKIGSVWMDAASAIQGWWAAAAKLGPFAGPVFGGLMTAATTGFAIAQTALINKQMFVPAMQEGGIAFGATRVNERGGEILNLPGGTVVIPNDISREIAKAGGSSAPNINISFAGAKISNDMDLGRITDVVIKKLGRELRLAT